MRRGPTDDLGRLLCVAAEKMLHFGRVIETVACLIGKDIRPVQCEACGDTGWLGCPDHVDCPNPEHSGFCSCDAGKARQLAEERSFG